MGGFASVRMSASPSHSASSTTPMLSDVTHRWSTPPCSMSPTRPRISRWQKNSHSIPIEISDGGDAAPVRCAPGSDEHDSETSPDAEHAVSTSMPLQLDDEVSSVLGDD